VKEKNQHKTNIVRRGEKKEEENNSTFINNCLFQKNVNCLKTDIVPKKKKMADGRKNF
jgi:hypothetical protein